MFKEEQEVNMKSFMEQETRKKLKYSKSDDFKELSELGQIIGFF